MAEDELRPLNTYTDKVPEVDSARCTGCGRCIAACKPRLFGFEQQGRRKISVLLDRNSCTGCGKCFAECPVGAIIPELCTCLSVGR